MMPRRQITLGAVLEHSTANGGCTVPALLFGITIGPTQWLAGPTRSYAIAEHIRYSLCISPGWQRSMLQFSILPGRCCNPSNYSCAASERHRLPTTGL